MSLYFDVLGLAGGAPISVHTQSEFVRKRL